MIAERDLGDRELDALFATAVAAESAGELRAALRHDLILVLRRLGFVALLHRAPFPQAAVPAPIPCFRLASMSSSI